MSLKEKLNSIRALIDADVSNVDIDSVINKGHQLSQIFGLSAECEGEARTALNKARRIALIELEKKNYPPSVLLKIAEAMCEEETAQVEYSDRLNAAITHQLDFYRSVISLHKAELENSLK